MDLDLEASLIVSFMDGLIVGATLEPKRVTHDLAVRMLEAMLARLGAPHGLAG